MNFGMRYLVVVLLATNTVAVHSWGSCASHFLGGVAPPTSDKNPNPIDACPPHPFFAVRMDPKRKLPEWVAYKIRYQAPLTAGCDCSWEQASYLPKDAQARDSDYRNNKGEYHRGM